MDLCKEKCSACRPDTSIIPSSELSSYLQKVPGWQFTAGTIRRMFPFKNFPEALTFFNRVAQLAEAEGHHPDMGIVNYKEVVLSLKTHAARGLTKNDFIMAAKVDKL